MAKSAPDSGAAADHRAGQRRVAALERRGVAFVPRGAGTGLSGGCLPLNAPVMICTSRMNRILADRSRQPPRRSRKRRGQSARDQRGQGRRLFLRARSVVAGRLHDRRQYRRELRRPAYAEVRRHHQSRAGRRAGAAGRRSRRVGRSRRGALRLRPGRRGGRRRGHRRNRDARDAAAACANPQAHRTMLAIFADVDDATARGLRDYRRGNHPRRDRDDGPADHPRGRGGVSSRVSRRRRRRADRRDSTGSRPG